MVLVKCSGCGEVLLEDKGMDVDTNKIGDCPKCGCSEVDVDIEC